MTMLTRADQFHEESLWFGTSDRPLFGRLTTPVGNTALGGVLLSPPIGRESRQARRALRSLAMFLAVDGYVSLRYDHFGTGDSSGSMEDEDFDRAWVDGVDQGISLLRSLGITSVSAVGMRMGATIVGTAASAYDLGLSSFAMWDPCESGRTFVRELTALGALGRDVSTSDMSPQTNMLEYALSDDAASRMSEFSLTKAVQPSLADRVLVVARDDRAISKRFRECWNFPNVEWAMTSEQGAMLEAQLPLTVQPASTIAQIRAWLTAPSTLRESYSNPPLLRDAVVLEGQNTFPVRESLVDLGIRKMFGVVSEPVGDTLGPLIVMVNGVNEDHVGPARLWVELSRRWASLGLRCVRFDLSDLGESPWLPGQPDRSIYDKTRPQDIIDAVRDLHPANPEDSVLIGYCNGAQLSLEVALELKTRAVCAMNPQVGTGVFLNVDRLETSERESVLSSAQRADDFLKRHRWFNDQIRRVGRSVLSSKTGGKIVSGALRLSSICPPKIRSAFAKNGTEILLLLSPEDLSSLRLIPVLGSVVRRRLASSEHFRVEIVPGLDHAFLSTIGRDRAVALLDRHVVETLARPGVQLQSDSHRAEVEGL